MKMQKMVLLGLVLFSLTVTFAFAAYRDVTCPTCQGLRDLPCDYEKCERGYVKTEGRTAPVRCKVCGGDEWKTCTQCRGDGNVRQWFEE